LLRKQRKTLGGYFISPHSTAVERSVRIKENRIIQNTCVVRYRPHTTVGRPEPRGKSYRILSRIDDERKTAPPGYQSHRAIGDPSCTHRAGNSRNIAPVV